MSTTSAPTPTPLRRLLRATLKFVFRRCFRLSLHGLENIEGFGEDERVILVCNHASFLDALILGAHIGDRFAFAVDTEIAKKWWMRAVLKLVRAVPINSLNPFAIRELIAAVEQDNLKLMIFPEGRITVTGGLMKIYQGAGLIAHATGATVVPAHIVGAEFSKFSRMGRKIPTRLFPRITVHFFKGEKLQVPGNVSSKEKRTMLSQQIRQLLLRARFETKDIDRLLFSQLVDSCRTYGWGREALADLGRRITCRKLVAAQFVVGDALEKMAGSEGRIGVLLPTSVATAIVFFGCHIAGLVPAMLNFSAGKRSVLASADLAGIRTVVTSRLFVEKGGLEELVGAIKGGGIRIVHLEDLRERTTLAQRLGGLLRAHFPERSFNASPGAGKTPEDPAVVLFTSGSEGVPKGVALSHRNLVANIAQVSTLTDLTCEDRILNVLPTFHSFGLTAGMLLPLFSGAFGFQYPSPLHYRVVPEVIYTVRATLFFSTNTFLHKYGTVAESEDMESLRLVLCGAEKLQERTRNLWLTKFGVRIFEGYGVTETSPGISFCTPAQDRQGTVGPFLPGIRHRLEKVEGIDEGRRLLVAGPNVMAGYLANDPEKGVTVVPPEGGWHDTGDIVTIDTHGFLKIVGRAKRFAKISGEMVSLASVEEAVNRVWERNVNAVVTVPDEERGETIVAVTDRRNPTREELLPGLKAQGLAELSFPRRIVHMGEIPLLGSGKPDYRGIQDRLPKGD